MFVLMGPKLGALQLGPMSITKLSPNWEKMGPVIALKFFVWLYKLLTITHLFHCGWTGSASE